MKPNKKKPAAPNEIVFGSTTRSELDELIYSYISVRIHNNMRVPDCFCTGLEGGLYSPNFADYEAKKFGFAVEEEDGYNFDI